MYLLVSFSIYRQLKDLKKSLKIARIFVENLNVTTKRIVAHFVRVRQN